jgi:uncharacterized phage protein (TIGR01671 family)
MSQREILFRAKRLDNGEWVEGYYVFCPDGPTHLIFTGDYYHEMITTECSGIEWSRYTIDPTTLCQFTGLRDKNGERIWEGDRLSVINPGGDEDQECIVNYDTTAGGYVYESFDGFGDYDLTTIGWAQSLGYDFTRLGSIHDGEVGE